MICNNCSTEMQPIVKQTHMHSLDANYKLQEFVSSETGLFVYCPKCKNVQVDSEGIYMSTIKS